jgi:uncharacterized membrane protein (UPF0136 family)
MKNEWILVWGYAALLLGGGVIGYLFAGSMVSLLISTFLSFLLVWTGYGMRKGRRVAYRATIGILIAIVAFFGYRFFLTFKVMPAGFMLVLTLIVLGAVIYLAEKNRSLTL